MCHYKKKTQGIKSYFHSSIIYSTLEQSNVFLLRDSTNKLSPVSILFVALCFAVKYRNFFKKKYCNRNVIEACGFLLRHSSLLWVTGTVADSCFEDSIVN